MTINQLLASDPERSVWVSASAGTGKTKVLTDRVLRLLLAGTAPGSILCVTFTKAAAAEMLDRIERELGRWAVADDAALQQSLTDLSGEVPEKAMLARARQLFALVLDAPDRLRVQTIHSFCQSVLARFPVEAGISPHMTLLDEHDSADMLAQARHKLFLDSRKDGGERITKALNALAQSLAESSLQELLERILSERKHFVPWLDAQDGAERFLAVLHERLKVPPGMNEAKLKEQWFQYTPEEQAGLRRVASVLAQSKSATDRALADSIVRWLETRADVQAYACAFFTTEGALRKKLYTNEAVKRDAGVPEVIDAEAKRAEGFTQMSRTLRIMQSSEHMMVLAKTMLNHYRDEKARRGVMDYDDLIMHTVQLLQRSDAAAWVLFKLDGAIDHLLVDEAQDTSPEQWQIVEALVSEFFAGEGARRAHRTLFVVGDEKQSIFSFQGAEPAIFDRMRMMLGKRARDAEAEFTPVRLDTSFRSTEAVLAAVDGVFALPEARDGLVFSESDLSHTAHRKSQPGRVELWPLLEGDEKEKKNIWDDLSEQAWSPSPEQRMAEALASEIKGWLMQGRILPAHARPVTPGDIMILVQRRGGFAGAMLRALKRAGIAVAGADRLVITEHIAVMDCMALGNFLLLPEDSLTLAALLKSPLVGLNDDDLFKLAHGREKKSLWQRLRASDEYADAADFLSQMLARADYMPPYELFSHALVTLGKRKTISARLGREADDPLNEFLNLALQYERSHPPSLQGFMHWLTSAETEIKRDMEKGRDEVRILTVHASKGLQAPIVFMPDTTRTPRHPGNLQWMDGEPPVPLWSEAAQFDDAHMDALKQREREEAYREYRRLLYVAMTRAEDELYICGWKGTRAIQKGCWYDLVAQAAEGWQADGERKLLTNSGDAKAKHKHAEAVQEAKPLPAWASQLAPDEPRPTKPLSPSQMEEKAPAYQPATASSARARGVLAHRLLQFLPDYEPAEREAVTQKLLARYGAELTAWDRDEVVRHVQAVLAHPEFAAVFAKGSVAEVPVVGIVEDADGRKVTIAGQIDRLAVDGDTVLIVDFKTDKAVPQSLAELPAAYGRQMAAYRTLVERIYPDKTVKCAIIWTAIPALLILAA